MDEEKKGPNQLENKRADIQRRQKADSNNIEELRARLYARNAGTAGSVRHTLKHENQIPDIVPEAPPTQEKATPEPQKEVFRQPENNEVLYTEPMTKKSRRSSVRKAAAISGVVFFIVAIAVASMFMFWGNKTISGDNITITTSGQLSIGGGEEMSFQVSIANQNTVPIKAATLIIEYPQGTKSAVDKNKELTLERLPLDSIGSDELINIPLKAVIYGEENEEKEIHVRIEYRVEGSNATFEKKSAPLAFKVSTSPVVMTFDAVESISSGQELELTLTVQSNSPTPLSNILIKATYPVGFDYVSSEPDTISGEDTWSIKALLPNEKQTIVIKGEVTGGENEVQTFDVVAGVGSERDSNVLISQLATARTGVIIEQPFLDVGMTINSSSKEVVVVDEGAEPIVFISFTNTLDTTLYDGEVFVELGGNALDEFRVKDTTGFYDSSKNTITWDSAGERTLREIPPGQTVRLDFSLNPDSNVGRAPEVTIKATLSVERRVFSNQAPQKLEGIVSRTIKVASVPEIDSNVLYGNGPFTNTGPVPPIAETVTQYTYRISAEAGINDVTDAEVTAVLPQYVSWLDLVQGDGSVTYNATTRTMTWNIGDMDSGETQTMYAQISLQPSLSQVGTSPTLLQTQRFEATDRFTGTTIRVDGPALTATLSDEPDGYATSGKVRKPE